VTVKIPPQEVMRSATGRILRTDKSSTTTKRSQSAQQSTARTAIAQRIQQLMAGRTGLESPTSGRKSPETQGSGSLKLVSRVYPT